MWTYIFSLPGMAAMLAIIIGVPAVLISRRKRAAESRGAHRR